MDKWQDHITTEGKLIFGKPVIKGTNITVESIMEKLASGWTEQQLLTYYPDLTVDDIKAVYAYAYDNIKNGLLWIQNRPR